ncbi:hypothetical protein SPRG_08747 [Saprolegnia parasitica CBS 223.65]|uniref:EF-hand domain-containing protein n=1 Tax=Saprolegnia parasitica (strain CBS 223.65) TaxID=695850 RepID=A0A067C4W0_SAPPC|nr:hypothetical protein SPRG_08747 [Saprolegnia parasitica CBS 223.65]KDO25804.1 hypothetical protein SPRG_08747 [Saprolegnia parasitica CBS 223.65]|eukprot:XP_012203369.1 hypothetical protein SPRG_08747 [Saprolegnia parasitica CBS 223.65]
MWRRSLLLRRLAPRHAKVARRFQSNPAAKDAAPAADGAAVQPMPVDQGGFFSRHPEYVFGAVILAIGGYIYRGSKNRKFFEAIQNEIADATPISPYEAFELRSQNDITPDVFQKVHAQAKAFFPTNEASVRDFDLCLGSVLNGMQLKNLHHLERVLMSLPKNDNGKCNLDTLMVAFSLAVKGDVNERLACLFQLQAATKDATLSLEQIEAILEHILTTYQVPAEKRVVAVDDKAYPFQEYTVGSAHELLQAAVQAAIKDKSLPEVAPTQYTLDDFNLLLKSKSVCIWGECFSSKRRMKAN